MIIRHKIIKENNEEILVVYLDNNLEEFARELDDDSNESEKNLRQQIHDYIKNRNVKFKGNVVKILAGGLLVGTLALTTGVGMKVSAAPANQAYVVQSGDSLWSIANHNGLSVTQLKQLNNLTNDTIYPGQTLALSQVQQISTSENVYMVKAGDSLYKIANENNLSVSQLKTYNNLTRDEIYPGEALLLTPNSQTGIYTVKTGDSLWSIANQYGMTVNDLKQLNNNIQETIYPGQRINVIQAQAPAQQTYTVQAGDSLWAIGNKFNMSVAQLQAMNNLTTNIIQPGQVLNVTNTNPTTTPPTNNPPTTQPTLVTVQRSNGEIQKIPLEQYVTGVVAGELGAGYNRASYEAQALAARTYALKRVDAGQMLTDTNTTQVYRDPAQLRADWGTNDYNTYYPEIQSAVNATKGQVIEYNGQLIDAVFFSTSNGRTEDPVYVWGTDVPYLKSVNSSWDTQSPYYYHVNTYSYTEFVSRLGISSNNLFATVTSRTANGSVNTINISGRVFSGRYVESHLGLSSTDFDIHFANGVVTINQRGWGHGVGLSQYGAYQMGQQGYTYQQIIHHYYTGVDIVTL